MKQQGHSSRIGKYRVERVLGHGGMGSVYRGVHTGTGRTVALKRLNPAGPLTEILDGETLRELFISEALTMSRLSHPNIIEVLDFDFDNGQPFYAMEYFCNDLGMLIGEGIILEEPSRPVPPEKTLEYGRQMLAGLQYLHDAGIIHRDIKPCNIMLNDRDIVKICDFGMARLQERESLGDAGINIGSPYYSAPEQIRDPEQTDARADLYSAGVLLYRMLTGELPAMKDFMLSHVDPLYDASWDRFFSRALSWKPELRFRSAAAMAEELARLELHWEKMREKECPELPAEWGPGHPLPLRSRPVRVSGAKAREAFGVDGLWQPRTRTVNRFRLTENGSVLDETTGLIWQRSPSDSPLDRAAAEEFIKALNKTGRGGIDIWRLPTVNELLSLRTYHARSGRKDCENLLRSDCGWFWSSDRRSPETSWYVNTLLGYAGWQYDSCLYSVRAVASSPDPDH